MTRVAGKIVKVQQIAYRESVDRRGKEIKKYEFVDLFRVEQRIKNSDTTQKLTIKVQQSRKTSERPFKRTNLSPKRSVSQTSSDWNDNEGRIFLVINNLTPCPKMTLSGDKKWTLSRHLRRMQKGKNNERDNYRKVFIAKLIWHWSYLTGRWVVDWVKRHQHRPGEKIFIALQCKSN